MPENFPKEQLCVLATAIIAEMQKPYFADRVKAAIVREPVPATEEDVLLRYESVQAEYFRTDFDTSALAVNGAAAPSGALDGEDVLRQLREACERYKDPEIEKIITQLCVIEETQIGTLIATVPQLAPIASRHEQQQHQGHQHSHGGAAGSHGHSHAGSHGHSHAGSHGHSHAGGVPGTMPQMTPQGMRMVEMAMQTLTADQRDTLERVQATMNGGSPPTPEDMREMFLIQQHIMAFMTTMQQFQARGRGGAPQTSSGRGAGR